MTADPLLARLSAVPMRCGNCGLTGDIQAGCGASYQHAWETDDAAIVRAVRAWLRDQEPNAALLALIDKWSNAGYLAEGLSRSHIAGSIRALYRRAWSAGEEASGCGVPQRAEDRARRRMRDDPITEEDVHEC